MSSASYVAISRGSLSSLVVDGLDGRDGDAHAGLGERDAAVIADHADGLMPDMDLPEFVSLSYPVSALPRGASRTRRS